MNRKRVIVWIAGAITSLIVAIALPFLNWQPVIAQTVPPAPQVTELVTTPGATVNLTIYGAISLREALKDVENTYNNNTTTSPKINFTNKLDSSGILLQNINYNETQTSLANIPDIFISAARSQITSLQNAGKLATGWPQDLVKNRLVLITPKTPVSPAPTGITGFSKLLNNPPTVSGVRGVAIGDPTIVPAGTYAQQLLSNSSTNCGAATYTALNNTNTSPTANRLVFATNVRNVLSAVENATLANNGVNYVIDAGLVYITDKNVSSLVNQIGQTAPSTCFTTPIVYPEAVLTRSQNLTASNSFANFIRTNAAARTAFSNRGFITN